MRVHACTRMYTCAPQPTRNTAAACIPDTRGAPTEKLLPTDLPPPRRGCRGAGRDTCPGGVGRGVHGSAGGSGHGGAAPGPQLVKRFPRGATRCPSRDCLPITAQPADEDGNDPHAGPARMPGPTASWTRTVGLGQSSPEEPLLPLHVLGLAPKAQGGLKVGDGWQGSGEGTWPGGLGAGCWWEPRCSGSPTSARRLVLRVCTDVCTRLCKHGCLF